MCKHFDLSDSHCFIRKWKPKEFLYSLSSQKASFVDMYAGQQTTSTQSFLAYENLWNFEMRILSVCTAYGCKSLHTHILFLNLHGFFPRKAFSPKNCLSCCQQKILNQGKFDGIICLTWWGKKNALPLLVETHVFYCVKIHNSFKEGIVCVWYEEIQKNPNFMAYQFRSLSYKFAEEGKFPKIKREI